jgi:tetratricopeptide (TPR) repeat protein
MKIFRKRRIQMKTMKKWLYVLIVVFIAGCGGGAQVASVGWQEQYDLGLRYLSEGGYEEAVVAFTAAIAIDPKQVALYTGRGDAYVGLAQYESAITDYEQALTLDENAADIYLKLSDAYVTSGDNDNAVAALKRGYEITGDGALYEELNVYYLNSLTEEQRLLLNQLAEALRTQDYMTGSSIEGSEELQAIVDNAPGGKLVGSWSPTRDELGTVGMFYRPDADSRFFLRGYFQDERYAYSTDLFIGANGDGYFYGSQHLGSYYSLNVVRYTGGKANGPFTVYTLDFERDGLLMTITGDLLDGVPNGMVNYADLYSSWQLTAEESRQDWWPDFPTGY